CIAASRAAMSEAASKKPRSTSTRNAEDSTLGCSLSAGMGSQDSRARWSMRAPSSSVRLGSGRTLEPGELGLVGGQCSLERLEPRFDLGAITLAQVLLAKQLVGDLHGDQQRDALQGEAPPATAE